MDLKNTSSLPTLTALPTNWMELEEVLLINIPQEGNGVSFFIRNHVEEVRKEFPGQLICIELSALHYQSWLEDRGIYQLPTLVVCHRGEIKTTFSGIFPRRKLKSTLQTLLSGSHTNPHNPEFQ